MAASLLRETMFSLEFTDSTDVVLSQIQEEQDARQDRIEGQNNILRAFAKLADFLYGFKSKPEEISFIVNELKHFNELFSIFLQGMYYYGVTGLELILRAKHKELIEMVCDDKITDPDVFRKLQKTINPITGDTLLHLIARLPREFKEEKVKLLRNFTEKEIIDHRNLLGKTALHNACRVGCIEAVTIFLRMGADTAMVNRKNETLLDHAILSRNIELANCLINNGAKIISSLKTLVQISGKRRINWVINKCGIDIQDEQGNTLLYYAILFQNDDIKIQLSVGSPTLTLYNKNNEGLLHCSAMVGDALMVKYLLVEGVPVNAQDGDGNTPLHIAAAYGHIDIVKILLNYPGSTILLNKEGRQPIDVAKHYEQNDVVSIFEEHGQHKSAIPKSSLSQSPITFSNTWSSLPVIQANSNRQAADNPDGPSSIENKGSDTTVRRNHTF